MKNESGFDIEKSSFLPCRDPVMGERYSASNLEVGVGKPGLLFSPRRTSVFHPSYEWAHLDVCDWCGFPKGLSRSKRQPWSSHGRIWTTFYWEIKEIIMELMKIRWRKLCAQSVWQSTAEILESWRNFLHEALWLVYLNIVNNYRAFSTKKSTGRTQYEETVFHSSPKRHWPLQWLNFLHPGLNKAWACDLC